MDKNRKGESGITPFRTGRVFSIDTEWYFSTREGIDKGPYENRGEAEAALNLFLRELGVLVTEEPREGPDQEQYISGNRLTNQIHPILQQLAEGEANSTKHTDQAIREITNNPTLFHIVFDGMVNENPLIRMRSAETIEKFSKLQPEYLQTVKDCLVNDISSTTQKELRWHIAKMFCYLELSTTEAYKIIQILLEYLKDPSNIVKSYSLQSLIGLAGKNDKLRNEILVIFQDFINKEQPPIRTQAEKLLASFAEKSGRFTS